MRVQTALLPIAITCLCVIIIGASAGTILAPIGVIGAGLGAAWTGVVFWRERRGRYDLSSLREVHERAALDAIEAELDLDQPFDAVICPACGEKYSPTFPTCPFCARRQLR